jgi:hypothetical protein
MAKARKSRKKQQAAALVAAEPYVPTNKECDALSLILERMEKAPGLAPVKIEARDGATNIGWNHPSQPVGAVLWANALGTADLTFAAAVMDQIAHVARTGAKLEENELNGMLSLVRGLEPKDPTEALLATQMAAIHVATMTAARRLTHVETLAQQDSASSMLNKLARTFAAQVEALKRYRLKGEQTIKVQHVVVNDGGKAIIGDVTTQAGGALKSENQSHEQLATSDALGPALLGSLQAHGQPLPRAGSQGKTRVPVPRGTRRSAEGQSQRRLPPRPLHP